MLQAWTTRLSKVISEGIKKGEVRPGVEALKLSQRIIGSLEGALLINRLTKSDEPLHEVREILDEYLERNVRGVRVRSKRANARSN